MAESVETLRRQRLDARLGELEKLIGFTAATTGTADPWQTYAQQNLDQAREALQSDRTQAAWTYCHQGYRFLYWSLDDEDARQQRAKPLRREAEEKLKNWRKEAILDVIGREPEPARPPSKGDLLLAQYLLDGYFANVYFKLDVLASRARALPPMLALLVGAVLFASYVLGADTSETLNGPPKPASFLLDFGTTVFVALLGALGAALSNALSALSAAERIPQVLKGWIEWTLRPLVGAISAIVVVLVLQSGLLPIESPSEPMLYAYAVAAGFTDRLLNRVMLAVERSVER